jgi:hypothetical protein
MLADQANHDSLAHAIGSAALARIGVHPPSAFQAGQVIHSFGPGSLPPTPMPPVHPILGPAVAS